LIPRRCTTAEYEARLLGTSLRQLDIAGTVAIPREDVCFRISGALRRSPPLTMGLPSPETALDGRLLGDLSGRVDWRVTPKLRLLLSANAARNDTEGVDRGATGAVFDSRTLVETADFTIRPELTLAENERLRLSLRQSFFRHQLLQDQRESSELDQ